MKLILIYFSFFKKIEPRFGVHPWFVILTYLGDLLKRPFKLNIILEGISLMLTLDMAPIGSIVELVQLDGDLDIVNRLIDMGFRPGAQIEYIKRMINQGPLVLRLNSTLLALRNEEASCLKVKI